jgi:hypothetical protein
MRPSNAIEAFMGYRNEIKNEREGLLQTSHNELGARKRHQHL